MGEVKRSADIVDIVSRYVSLKKAGRTFKALCPFHTEKTPSFIVNPERQMFRCFGCGKAGDVFSFVAEHERVDFPEAVRIVASAVGVTIPETRGRREGPSKELKTRLYDLHRWAAEFFVRQLAQEASGAKARDYLAARRFDKKILDAWSVGYAPDSWDALGNAARGAGFSDKELIAGGLVIPRNEGNGYYDRFRNRVVFPIRDIQGRAIAFGARTLEDSEVKYLNSPETPLFSKSRCLYGLDKARDPVIQGRRVMITEGYTDTLMCHQAGIDWAVATLGTALTRDHVALLRRYADTVVLLFDADKAGEAAVDRSLEVFGEFDLDVRVPELEQGMDPCDFLVSDGPEAFVGRVDAARELFEVKLDLSCRRHDMATSDGRARAMDEALKAIALIANAAKADLLTEAIARRVGVDREAARRRLADFRKPPRRTRGAGPARDKEPPIDPVEEGVLRSVLASCELVPCVLARVTLEDFQDARVRRILEQCVGLYDREGEIDLAELSASLQDMDLAAIVARTTTEGEDGWKGEAYLQGCLEKIEARKQKAEYGRLRERALGGDPEALAAMNEHHRRRAGKASSAPAD